MSIFQTWAIAQAIIDMFFPIVKLCVLNQNVGYWLLLNALHSAFTLCITMKANVARAQTLNQPLIHGVFASTCNQTKVHNMLVIMLDLHFKNMKVIHDFVGNAHAIQIVTYYDVLIFCALFY